ncbi:hypothetical protein BJ944DRAFT_123871 [Cunninghamella echinulata]|nr:hypothetical protein BJ944DRAFT_123871 [Cunninghamella echinulata]
MNPQLQQQQNNSTTILPPNQAHTKKQVYDSDTDSLHGHIWSPAYTIMGSISSAATLNQSNISSSSNNSGKDQKSFESTTTRVSTSSIWLQHHQRRSKLYRYIFNCVGFIVLLALLGTIFLWIGSSFIFPQKKYTTEISHVPFPSSSSFSSNSHPSSTIQINHPLNSTL